MARQSRRVQAVADACAQTGVRVEYEYGWRTRGRRAFDPRGFTNHHDASPPGSSARSVIRDGRSGLPGPLAHFYIERDGTVAVIAAGRANHAGRGGWRGLSGNSSVWGVEIANNGTGETYGDAQLRAVLALNRAIRDVDGVDVKLIHAHHEWAPRRKIDPSVDPQSGSGTWNMDRLRQQITETEEDELRLTEGSKGKYVGRVQIRLRQFFDTDRIAIDEHYGPQTRDHVAEFQKQKNLLGAGGAEGGVVDWFTYIELVHGAHGEAVEH